MKIKRQCRGEKKQKSFHHSSRLFISFYIWIHFFFRFHFLFVDNKKVGGFFLVKFFCFYHSRTFCHCRKHFPSNFSRSPLLSLFLHAISEPATRCQTKIHFKLNKFIISQTVSNLIRANAREIPTNERGEAIFKCTSKNLGENDFSRSKGMGKRRARFPSVHLGSFRNIVAYDLRIMKRMWINC